MESSALLLAGVLCLGARSAAQTPCGASSGPDLVVEIGSIVNYTVAGGIDSFSLQLFPLNVGDAHVACDGASAQHPVFGQSLYRLTWIDGASRFEELGQSWLRHGVANLSLQDFCICGSAGTTDLLGPGCNDSLSASVNGTASALGPRWQIDAALGTNVFPPANPPISGPHPRRIQAATGELAPSGGAPGATRFFAEVQSVAADDAAAGNAANGTSWIELAVAPLGGEWHFATLGSTQREQPALAAWAAHDPNVRLATVDVPGDGRFVLGSAATQLSATAWRYEYALENLTSTRGAASFSVPLPNGMVTHDHGFHDVASTNGDGIGGVDRDGTDWAPQPPGSALEWRTSTFAQDPNGNALRWSTTYNFRFDCDRPPMDGAVTVGLFAPAGPGAPSEITFDAAVPYDLAVLAGELCVGDGTGASCPCANHSAQGHGEGCASSLGVGGFLRAEGAPSVAHDTLALQAVQMPNATAIYLQASASANGGLGIALGDGLACVDGALVRLGSAANVFGASQYPSGGQPSVSVRGGASAGATFTYQVWYRNAASFCTSATFNLTNGLRLTWIP